MASCGSCDLGVTLYGGLPAVGVVLIYIQSFSEASRVASTTKMGISKLSGEFSVYFLLGISPGGLATKHCGNIQNDTVTAVCCRGVIASPAFNFLLSHRNSKLPTAH